LPDPNPGTGLTVEQVRVIAREEIALVAVAVVGLLEE
jgi:hypothetical protein